MASGKHAAVWFFLNVVGRMGANLVNMTDMSNDNDAVARARQHVAALRASL